MMKITFEYRENACSHVIETATRKTTDMWVRVKNHWFEVDASEVLTIDGKPNPAYKLAYFTGDHCAIKG